ncbi:DUF1015 domain-containing protein [Geomesophilobacter sediminis]|uniref:DUF1015 domain-containing protein n=1 Tax=Geomesophilobacter sediminis TaxID=2798584 RepID=A0A8J7S9N5_9BACT|nr:DUF1015 family protein [Geomesophilobacter sediminis]MBJ6726940.1 DUF1015 domain-containing protein [Geomesophilobacter sediminis]
MAFIKPFKGVRPVKELAEKVASLPYDVMNTKEAIRMAEGNEVSFLHISRPEIDFPLGTDEHSDQVYRRGHENLERFLKTGVLLQDETDRYYVYKQRMGNITQTGLVVCAGVDDYQSGAIKKHELTRADKEEDRVRHIDTLDANDEPVFYTYRHDPAITALVDSVTAGAPLYDFVTDDGVSHTLWAAADPALVAELTARFAAIPTLYVADGHHRSAAASRVRELRKAANPAHNGTEEYNFFLTVIFPDNEMNIMPYNRVVKDLNDRSVAEFMAQVAERFLVTPVAGKLSPTQRHQYGMYLAGKWYELVPREGTFVEGDPVGALDVSILQDNLLSPVLGIRNPRTDQRIHFVGGIRGIEELERVVDSGEYQVAFSLFPTSMEELMSLADQDKIMPPKSTWFEPKLRSGLFIHMLD